MSRNLIHAAVVFVLLVSACSPALTSAAPVQLDDPLPVYVVATDGQRYVGTLVRYDDQGFDLKDTAGKAQRVAWEKLPAKAVYQLHEKLLKPSDKSAWASLAQRLAKFKDGKEWAGKAQERAGGQAPKSPLPTISPHPATVAQKPEVTTKTVAPGQWVDLLVLAETGLDAVEGEWKSKDNAIHSPTEQKFSRMTLPVMPDGDYEFEVEFERVKGNDAAAVMFPVGEVQLAMSLGWVKDGKNSLEFIDGQALFSKQTGLVTNKRRHRLLVRVEIKEDNADIDTRLDGQTLIQYSGPLKKLSTHKDWRLSSLKTVGLGAQGSQIVFHQARLKMLSGELKTESREARIARAVMNPELPKAAGDFLTSLAVDKQGNLWVGTEGKGVWRFTPSAPYGKQWKQFTRVSTGGDDESYGPSLTYGTPNQNALGDDFAYAMAVDDLGRVWVGHLNHGVSVFNGKEWRNYDRITGPLGERIFDIEVAPPLEQKRDTTTNPLLDAAEQGEAGKQVGDIWIASSLGLARYSPTTKKWTYRTRVDGLPEDQVQALAFDKQGRMYAGTQCHGVAIADPDDDYKSWRRVTGPDPFPNTPTGSGLPSNLINDVLVAQDGTVYVATNHGLAKSADRGETWSYIRGRDWEAMVKGLYKGPKPEGKVNPGGLLAEDYITSLSEDSDGNLVVSFRQKGYEVYSSADGLRVVQGGTKGGYTYGGLVEDGYPLLLGMYGEGLVSTNYSIASSAEAGRNISASDSGSAVVMPAIAEQPKLEQLWQYLDVGPTVPTASACALLDEDWVTQGDWVGRYGRHEATLSAMHPPFDHYMGINTHLYELERFMGPHKRKDDVIRSWMWKAKDDGDRRVLYNPVAGVRRPAGWDDHAETYKWTHEGPDMWLKATIPEGIHRISLYFMNYDGHRGNNRFRDYLISVHEAKAGGAGQQLAKTRVLHHWAGVYKTFALQGPATYYVRIGKNNSFNTMISAVFFDRLLGEPTSLEKHPMPWLGGVRYRPSPLPDTNTYSLSALLHTANNSIASRVMLNSWARVYVLAYRHLSHRMTEDAKDTAALDYLRWAVRDWTGRDRLQFRELIVKEAWEKQVKRSPKMRWSGRQ